ncbi:Ig-like domain-containing protein [Nocardioides sp.]|uniref:Ig-like domain-containing protein n=1 Tax=Nocardioides sp. TaxID=35761 RepID=UPI00378522D0
MLALVASGLLTAGTGTASAVVADDDPSTATVVHLPLSGPSSVTLTNVGATRSPDDPSFYLGTGDGSPDDASPCYGAASAWYELRLPTAVAAGRVRLQLQPSSGFDAVLTVFKAQSASPDYATIDRVDPVFPAASVRAGQPGNSSSVLDFDMVGDGRPYLLAVAGCNTDFSHGDSDPGNTGTVALTSSFYQRAAADAFASSALLPALSVADVRTTSAGHEADEPVTYDGDQSCYGGQSMWLHQDPPAGTMFVRADQPGFHGVVTLATGAPGTALGDLQVVDRAEFGGGAGTGEAHATVANGARLWVRVEACNPDGVPILPLSQLGTVRLQAASSAVPANDDYADAPTLVGPNVPVTSQNEQASSEPGEAPAAVDVGADSGESVWYRWTVPSTGTWSVDTATSPFNTVLGVGHHVATVDQFVPDVATNDDSVLADGTSQVQFHAVAGTDLVIRLSGVDGAAVNTSPDGVFKLWVKKVPDTVAPAVSIASPKAGASVPAGTRLRIAVQATDRDSGVKKVVVVLPGDEERTLTRPSGRAYQVTVPVETGKRRWTFSAYAVDVAGNRSARVARTVTVTH